MTDTRELRFFHGTGANTAANIISTGVRNVVDEMGWRELARETYYELLKVAGGDHELFLRYLEHEDLLCGPGVTPLRSAGAREEGHLFIYGPFFVTLNIGAAYRYAVRNPYRSELLHAIANGLELLERLGAGTQRRELEARYPAILELINKPSPPVVLELCGIDESRFSNEDGSTPVGPRLELSRSLANRPGVHDPASFRVCEVTLSDVTAIHDLRDWTLDDILAPPWQPDPMRVEGARTDVRRWIEQHTRNVS